MQDPFAGNSPAPPPLPAALPPPLDHAASGGWVSEEDRTLGMLCHLLGIFTGFLGPLILWLVKKDRSAFVNHHGREALNFQLTILIIFIALGSATIVLLFVFVGFFLIPVILVLQVLAVVAEVMAAVAAQKGGWHRYPFCLRLV
ncbi:MAG: DUF4870 domain-containing protein [Verrucomicrobiota bacterium]